MAILKYKNENNEWESVETPGAVKFTEQTLTEAEKAQARANIGVGDAAGTPIVKAESTDGAAYTATVDGITALIAGVSFIMIPAISSTTKGPTIDVNGLGAKFIRRRLSSGATVDEGYTTAWLNKNKPFRLMYDGAQWVVEGHNKPVAADIYGPIAATTDVNGNNIVDTYATKTEIEAITTETIDALFS